jgi:HPt (histidine-containing phosphotransfer) domain-containing protein
MNYTQPIVALTANALAGQAEVFMKSGFDDFISKPIDIRQLNITLLKFIRDKQTSEVVEAAQKEKAEMDKKNLPASPKQVDSELAAIFARDAEKAVVVLENCMQNSLNNDNDVQMYIINVHSMKSALANIGVTELSNTARRLENAGREKDINVMLTETHEFINELKKVINNIKPKETENSEDSEESLVLLREKLKIIKDACGSYDRKLAKNTLNELKEKTWAHNTNELINTLSEHLLHSEFDIAANLVEEFLEK